MVFFITDRKIRYFSILERFFIGSVVNKRDPPLSCNEQKRILVAKPFTTLSPNVTQSNEFRKTSTNLSRPLYSRHSSTPGHLYLMQFTDVEDLKNKLAVRSLALMQEEGRREQCLSTCCHSDP